MQLNVGSHGPALSLELLWTPWNCGNSYKTARVGLGSPKRGWEQPVAWQPIALPRAGLRRAGGQLWLPLGQSGGMGGTRSQLPPVMSGAGGCWPWLNPPGSWGGQGRRGREGGTSSPQQAAQGSLRSPSRAEPAPGYNWPLYPRLARPGALGVRSALLGSSMVNPSSPGGA